MNKFHTSTVSHIIQLTPDCREIRFELPTSFDYEAGQFIMLRVPEPRQTEEWYIITPSHIFEYIKAHGARSVVQLAEHFHLDEKTILGYLKKLERNEAIVEEGGSYSTTTEHAPEIHMPPFQRAYSMATCPNHSNTISTMVKEMPGGFMSTYLLHHIEVGDAVEISGPFGRFTLPKQAPKHVVGIAAGSGITPLMSFARYIAADKYHTDFTLLFSNRTPEDIAFADELEQLQKHPRITVEHTLTRIDESVHVWEGRSGRIDQSMLEQHIKADTIYYICGPLAFANAMKHELLELGILKELIHMEAFG